MLFACGSLLLACGSLGRTVTRPAPSRITVVLSRASPPDWRRTGQVWLPPLGARPPQDVERPLGAQYERHPFVVLVEDLETVEVAVIGTLCEMDL